jgi:hypothetical protein
MQKMKAKKQEGIGSKERLNLRLSLADVARFYRGGSSRERIRQIEAGISVSPVVRRDYKAAIAAAVADLKDKGELLARVRAEMALEKESNK